MSREKGSASCTRETGRPFFNEKALEQELLTRLRAQVDTAGIWEELETDWLCLDCELMPWSAKAQSLIVDQYASVGAAGRAQSASLVAALECAAARALRLAGGWKRRFFVPHSSMRIPTLIAVLLAGSVGGRHEDRAVSSARFGREGSHRQGARLAHGCACSFGWRDRAGHAAFARRSHG